MRMPLELRARLDAERIKQRRTLTAEVLIRLERTFALDDAARAQEVQLARAS